MSDLSPARKWAKIAKHVATAVNELTEVLRLLGDSAWTDEFTQHRDDLASLHGHAVQLRDSYLNISVPHGSQD
jgi:hypothetical protein